MFQTCSSSFLHGAGRTFGHLLGNGVMFLLVRPIVWALHEWEADDESAT
jgi:hypothetical protein